MSKDKGKSNALLVGIASRPTRSSSSKNNNNEKGKAKAKDVDNEGDMTDIESLAIIQEKVSKFQPKINSILPRMLSKTNAAAAAAATTTTDTTPSKSNPAVEQGTSSGNSSGRSAKPGVGSTVATTKATTKESTPSKNKDKPATTISKKPATTAGSSSKSKSKKSPGPSGASIAALIPKGSRYRPLPQKAQEFDRHDASMTSSYTTRTEGQQDEVIVLSSSLTPASSIWENDHSRGGGGDDSAGDLGEVEIEPEQLNATTPTAKGDENVNSKKAASKITPATAKMPSIVSIGSTKSFDYASGIPSVQVDRIADWMGGVKEAMEKDKEEELHDLPSLPVVETVTPSITKTETGSKRSGEPTEPKTRAEARKPILRRPPPGIPRHTASTTSFSPSPPPEEPTASPVMVLSSLEGGSLMATSAEDERSDKGKLVLVQDSMPPMSSYQEISKSNESFANSSVVVSPSPSSPQLPSNKASAAMDTPAGPVVVGRNYHQDDEVSTVVGQPTQDSIGGLQSLPSFAYESGNNVSKEEEEYYERARQESKEPSLPSALTSSCLEELGLLKRKSSGQGKEFRKRRSRGGLSPADEGDEDDDDGIILAQMEAFPSSIGAAPASSSFECSSVEPSPNILEAPEYTHALPDRTRQSDGQDQAPTQDLDPAGETPGKQKQQSRKNGPRDTSFPSPPTQVTFSTLPTMPSFPSQLQSEPSLILLGSQNPNQTHKNGDDS
ncbi:hypothetical protein BGZ80_010145 [Entomortierella chlamydospora]|uniref:Uncharacterized protein n=1 Tax=Entomortierella chlamydospora TaxID=101097 RepID=A0A9P6MW00_9FUNG|nr:hypothetical protein BGZ79_010164 [Entomortierella chlamydospora]KAG0014935.1 hypothetical protein BGZ80_010145 [Entomortierella chlamydospora]